MAGEQAIKALGNVVSRTVSSKTGTEVIKSNFQGTLRKLITYGKNTPMAQTGIEQVEIWNLPNNIKKTSYYKQGKEIFGLTKYDTGKEVYGITNAFQELKGNDGIRNYVKNQLDNLRNISCFGFKITR